MESQHCTTCAQQTSPLPVAGGGGGWRCSGMHRAKLCRMHGDVCHSRPKDGGGGGGGGTCRPSAQNPSLSDCIRKDSSSLPLLFEAPGSGLPSASSGASVSAPSGWPTTQSRMHESIIPGPVPQHKTREHGGRRPAAIVSNPGANNASSVRVQSAAFRRVPKAHKRGWDAGAALSFFPRQRTAHFLG